MFKIMMVSWGGVEKDFINDIDTYEEAEAICESYNWVYESPEGGYIWDLEIEEE